MRNTQDYGPVHITTGTDHAIGIFVDITDDRFAGTKDDEQGEGYVFEYSELFGITKDLIKLAPEDIIDRNKVVELCNAFFLKQQLKDFTNA